ncbi:hypothetical protein [Bradyrhizobium aeschynomenes]|uniref:hypothetical protein n=1 Tax=Bradyrhizobium aeschynomenes TaxID=2734909 RepID=UPI001FEFFA8C|nr:hypothetical protein [Bradyrhizobium aeschynomenes]
MNEAACRSSVVMTMLSRPLLPRDPAASKPNRNYSRSPYFDGVLGAARPRSHAYRQDAARSLANPTSFNHNLWQRGEGTMRRMDLNPGMAAVLIGTAILLVPAAARAYTAEQEQACTSDAFRLCSSDIPNVDRVTACMVRRKAELSPPCRAQFGPQPRQAASSGRTDRPMSIRPAAKKPVNARAGKTKKPSRPEPT